MNYKISGTAKRGTDYQIAGTSGTAITGSVTIYGTASSAVIDITPYEREILGGGKTVIVSLSSGSGYNVASVFSTAMVTISDDYGAANYLGTGPVTATMTFFNSDGSSVQGSSDQAVLGDFIPLGSRSIRATLPARRSISNTTPARSRLRPIPRATTSSRRGRITRLP